MVNFVRIAAPGLLAVLALAQSAHAHPAATHYRVTNLGPGDLVGEPRINASGQVAFSLAQDLIAPLRSWLFDGSTLHAIVMPNGEFSRVTGLNERGQVVGQTRNTAGEVRSFTWSRARGLIELGAPAGANESWEPSLNNAGAVAGYATGAAMPYARAYRWTLASGMEDLGAFTNGAGSTSQATAINDAGLIAGNSLTASFDYHAFAWTRATGMVDIDTLGTRYSAPVAVGALGQVAGNFFVDGGRTGGFIWTRAGGMRNIGTVGAADPWVVAMSSGGRITGVLGGETLPQRAMTWSREGGLRALGTLGGDASAAFAANNKGLVVGAAATRRNDYHAFAWNAREGMVDLNRRVRHAPAGLVLESARAVNDNGAIVATSNAGLVLLTPTCGCGAASAAGHTVGPILAPATVAVGEAVHAAVTFASAGPASAHHVTWSWGDGSGEQAGSTDARKGEGTGRGMHRFGAPGLYTVRATVTDLAGRSVTVSGALVATDRAAGVAGGAGWFASPHAPLPQQPYQAGKGSFRFVAPPADARLKGAGAGQLQLDAGALSFRSTDLVQVGRQGAARTFAGSGSVNGAGRYQVELVATEAGAGRLALAIWRTDPVTGKQVFAYDNRRGAPIVEGRMVLP